jgi:hypothetical protein
VCAAGSSSGDDVAGEGCYVPAAQLALVLPSPKVAAAVAAAEEAAVTASKHNPLQKPAHTRQYLPLLLLLQAGFK